MSIGSRVPVSSDDVVFLIGVDGDGAGDRFGIARQLLVEHLLVIAVDVLPVNMVSPLIAVELCGLFVEPLLAPLLVMGTALCSRSCCCLRVMTLLGLLPVAPDFPEVSDTEAARASVCFVKLLDHRWLLCAAGHHHELPYGLACDIFER